MQARGLKCYYRASWNVLYNWLLGSFKLPASPLLTSVSIGEH